MGNGLVQGLALQAQRWHERIRTEGGMGLEQSNRGKYVK